MQNTAGVSVLSHTHKTQLHISLVFFLSAIHRLLVTNKERSVFPSSNNYQGQLQTPQSVSVVVFYGKKADC